MENKNELMPKTVEEWKEFNKKYTKNKEHLIWSLSMYLSHFTDKEIMSICKEVTGKKTNNSKIAMNVIRDYPDVEYNDKFLEYIIKGKEVESNLLGKLNIKN